MVKYDENSIKTLDYREAARQSLGMYIGSADINGMHHLATEIIANAMDEAAAGYGKLILVEIDRDDNSLAVTDNGRGIPYKMNAQGHYAIIEMCTNLHSGGKFEGQGNYKSSLGLNGVGATITNALSTMFEIDVWRDKEHCKFGVYDGEHDEAPEIEKYSGDKQGSKVRFIPDTKVFGNIEWDFQKLRDELQLHALLNNGITFQLIEYSGGKEKQNVKFLYKNGIKDMLKLRTEGMNILTDPAYFSTSVVNDNGVNCDVEYAFVYTDKSYETIYSFVNGGYTPNNGTHVTGWKTAFTSYINKAAKTAELIKDKNLSGDIVRRGLVLVLSIKMEERPLFAEQTKLTLNSPSARGFCSKAVGQMELDRKIEKQILDKIMIEQKAEEAAQRKREAQEKIARGGKNMNAFRDLPKKLADASDFTNAELFLVEGDSAAGGAKITKASNQAVLPLRGKIKNCTNIELADAIKSDIIKDLLVTFGCGVGDNFDIKNLRYDKIIFMTDADPDGGHIELLLATLILHHLPDLITQGKVYAAVPPLFKTVTARETKYWTPSEIKDYNKYIKTHKILETTRFKGLNNLLARNSLFC